MKFDVDDKNRCSLVCAKFHLNRCRFAAAVEKCSGGSLFWDTVYKHKKQRVCVQLQSSFTLRAASKTKQSANVRQLGVVSPAATSGSGDCTPPIAQTACRAGHRRR